LQVSLTLINNSAKQKASLPGISGPSLNRVLSFLKFQNRTLKY
jgi:hypothetical protein